MNIIFAGTPDFAAAALNAIADAGFHIALALTQPDRPKGRGLALQASPVKQAALARNIPVAQPESLKNNPLFINELCEIQADVMIVAAYGLILPAEVLRIPRHGCLNIHASLLPRWRGAAPIQRAIEAGDAQTGVCIMQMDEGLDTGDVISRHVYAIRDTDTAEGVYRELMHMGAAAIVQDLHILHTSGSLKREPQPLEGITYAAKLSKNDAKIQWQQSAQHLARQIRAFNPVPAAWSVWQGKPMKIWAAQACDGEGVAGTILSADSAGIVVACGEGALRITELQMAGAKRMNASAFVAGRTINVGEKLGD